MKPTQTFAQRHPFYMTAETTKRTIELGRALRAQIQRRRNSVRIRAEVEKYCESMARASAAFQALTAAAEAGDIAVRALSESADGSAA